MSSSDEAGGQGDPQTMDLAERIVYVMGDTGSLQEHMGGFRLRVIHERSFPWADVIKVFLVRGFKVHVTMSKAGLFVEAVI
jgi:hypothetical protein